MNKNLRKLHVSAKDIGLCLVCGGENGNCTCTAVAGSDLQRNQGHCFHDLRKDNEFRGNASVCSDRYFLCESCNSVIRVDLGSSMVKCVCGYFLKHVFIPSVIPEPDYTILEGLSDLPAKATRKPKIYRSRNRPGSGNG